MKVLTKEQFDKVPIGTIYCTCVNSAFTGNLSIKSEDRGPKSWWALDIMPWLETEMDFIGDYKNGEEIKTEEFCTDDATYNYGDETMFAVFSKQEVADMIKRMQTAIGY